MVIVVRRARPGEGEALGAIGFAAWAASAFGHHDGGRVSRTALLAEFQNFADERRDAILVAEVDGVLAGWGAREHQDHNISDLWIAPDYQNRGIGTALLKAIEAEIAVSGVGEIALETLASNENAIRFYERHGFVVTWRGEKFSSSLGYAIDKVGLNKSLRI